MSESQKSSTAASMEMEITTRMVQLLAEIAGRGPTKAKTVIGPDYVLGIFRDIYTRQERTLITKGHAAAVLELRQRLQEVARPAATQLIEEVTGRRVTAVTSAASVEADLSTWVFILE